MRTLTAISTEKVGLMAGLKWAALPDYSGGKISADIRGKVKLAQAQKILIHSVDAGNGVNASLGMYTTNDFEPPTARALHSLAAAFVYARPKHLHLILAWRIDNRRVSVVIIQDGLPIADEIKTDPEAAKLIRDARAGKMGATGHKVFSNDPSSYADAEAITETELIEVASKGTKLVRVPPRPVFTLVVAITILSVIAGTYAAYHRNVQNKKRQLAERIEAEDPLPPYQEQLAARIGRLGLQRASVLEAMENFSALKVWANGWLLTQIECSVGQCIFTWERQGGTTDSLLKFSQGGVLLSESTVNKAKVLHKVGLQQGGLPSLAAAVPMKKVSNDYVNIYQLWTNANLSVSQNEELKEFKIWPTPTLGDTSRLSSDDTLKVRPIKVTTPFSLVKEVIKTTPEAVWWESFEIKYSPSDVEKNLQVTLNGNTYVR
jgi:hypothetical protein